MERQKLLLTADSWDKILDELHVELDKALEVVPEQKPHENSLMLYVNTLLEALNQTFAYLPENERDTIRTFCASAVGLGVLYGRSPEVLLDILTRTGATGFYHDSTS